MRIRHEASVGIGSILLLQVLLSALAIVLLTRMGPAIERILEDNVFSSQAVQEMLAVLADPEADTDPVRIARFEDAFERARENVTEEGERPFIAEIRRHRAAALRGELPARHAVIVALEGLAEVNRQSMVRSDLRARRLGQAGAWAAAVLGAISFALGIMVYQRLRLRLELPVELLRLTLHRLRTGDMRARCVIAEAPVELRDVARDLNVVLDRWLMESAGSTTAEGRREATDVRRLLVLLLDRESAPVVVLGADGRAVAMNQAMQALPLPRVEADGAVEPGWAEEPIAGTALRLLRQSPPSET